MSATAILKLQKVGFTSEQVEALADFMDTQAASKADLERTEHSIRSDVERVEHGIRSDVERVEHGIRSDLAEAEHRLGTRIADVKGDVELAKRDLKIWFGSIMVAAVGIILAAIRYLPPHP